MIVKIVLTRKLFYSSLLVLNRKENLNRLLEAFIPLGHMLFEGGKRPNLIDVFEAKLVHHTRGAFYFEYKNKQF